MDVCPQNRAGLVSSSRLKNVVVRAGFGMYADRGEYFTELFASAGLGISGPFSVTTQQPFTVPQNTACVGMGCLAGAPFGTTPFPPPPSNLSEVAGLIYNQSQLSGCPEPVTPTCTPTGFANSDFLFGGYDPTNKLPYSENWSLDLQWQPKNDVVLTVAYIGNHGVHQPLPIPLTSPGWRRPATRLTGRFTAMTSRRRMPTQSFADRAGANDNRCILVLRRKYGSAHSLYRLQSKRGLLACRGHLHLQRIAVAGDQENVSWLPPERFLHALIRVSMKAAGSGQGCSSTGTTLFTQELPMPHRISIELTS